MGREVPRSAVVEPQPVVNQTGACEPLRTVPPLPDDAFDAYFRHIFPKAVATARRVTGDVDTAQDAAVEALARAYARWQRVAGLEWRDAWVLRVTIHQALRLAPRPPRCGPAVDVGDASELVDLRLALGQAL